MQVHAQPEIKGQYIHIGRCAEMLSSLQNFWSNSSDCRAKLGAHMTEYTSEMELYIILGTLENFEHWNQILFKNEISSSQKKLVQCSLAKVSYKYFQNKYSHI